MLCTKMFKNKKIHITVFSSSVSRRWLKSEKNPSVLYSEFLGLVYKVLKIYRNTMLRSCTCILHRTAPGSARTEVSTASRPASYTSTASEKSKYLQVLKSKLLVNIIIHSITQLNCTMNPWLHNDWKFSLTLFIFRVHFLVNWQNWENNQYILFF